MLRRGRFAPSLSGQLHIGNAFTALCAWLQIRQADGQFLLRIEDIDKPRSRPDLAEQQHEGLRWLGLDWDEGPSVGGLCAPYEQSRRVHLYEEALTCLQESGRHYPCYCSRADLALIDLTLRMYWPQGLFCSRIGKFVATCSNPWYLSASAGTSGAGGHMVRI